MAVSSSTDYRRRGERLPVMRTDTALRRRRLEGEEVAPDYDVK